MKTWKKILLLLLVVFVAGGAAILFWQRENLKALQAAKEYTPEEIEQKLTENDSVIDEAIEEYPEIQVRPITEEEKQALKEGELSPEELAERLVQTAQDEEEAEAETEDNKKSVTESEPEKEPEKESEKESEPDGRLSALIAELYVLRETYLQQLDGMMHEAAEEYANSSFSTSELAKFAGRYVSRATVLERECDRKMDTMVKKLRDLLKATNGDSSIVSTVISTYAEEKCLKKAWYLSEMQKRGLV